MFTGSERGLTSWGGAASASLGRQWGSPSHRSEVFTCAGGVGTCASSFGVLEPSLPRAFQVGGDGSLVIYPHNGSSEVRSLCWFSKAYSRLGGP